MEVTNLSSMPYLVDADFIRDYAKAFALDAPQYRGKDVSVIHIASLPRELYHFPYAVRLCVDGTIEEIEVRISYEEAEKQWQRSRSS